MPYTKKAWLDHIVDSGGAVVQQGTPLNAQNLNHLEEGVADAAAFTAGELGAATAYSGVLNHVPAIGYGIAVTAAAFGRGTFGVPAPAQYGSQLRLGYTDFHALIAGVVHEFKGFTPAATGNNIQAFDPAPTEGSRDDLFFVEVWRDPDTQEWKRRPRIVTGVDFSKTYAGVDYTGWNDNTNHTNITPQGGLSAPIPATTGSISSANLLINVFRPAYGSNYLTYAPIVDPGLWVAGDGSLTSKSALKTYDGYVYAIPMAKIARRNSGGYSVNNPNGAKDVKVVVFQGTGSNIDPGKTKNVTMSAADYALVSVGEEYYHASYKPTDYRYKIISKNGSNQVTVMSTGTGGVDSIGVAVLVSDRPDALYSNIIAERDITDLRHKTYLVAPSYEQLMIDGLDQILRGASSAEKKTAMRKTYVGVKKTPIDANHIFYASMDGTVTAEVGTLTTVTLGQNSSGFTPMPTGAGYRSPTATANQFTEITPTSGLGNTFTIEFFLDMSQSPATSLPARTIFDIKDANNLSLMRLLCNPASFDTILLQTATADAAFGTTYSISTPAAIRAAKKAHIRLTYNNGAINLYMNGALLYTLNFTLIRAAVKVGLTRSWIGLEGTSGNESYPGGTMIYSDFAISKVDRGAVFATLPADFIQGYADITPAFNYQRRINSDAPTSQKTVAAAKVQNQTQERGVTVTKGTGVNTAAWEAGDKIKVRGLAGEVISGVIDADTSILRLTGTRQDNLTSPAVVTVDGPTMPSVNDTLVRWDTITNTADVSLYTVTAVSGNQITVSWPSGGKSLVPGQHIFTETTSSTSSPVVRTIIAGTSTTVPGTWANLGTNEAEVTLGTLPGGLAAQDIIIEYSLNMAAGQGGLYQLYTAVLAGEANGKKLIPGTVAVTDDFAGKVTGSTTVNPNKAYSAVNGTAATPVSPGTEFSQGDYDAVKSLDNALKTVTTSVNGQSAAVLISIDLIRLFEDKYGKIPGALTTAGKVTWLKENIATLTGNWYGYANGLHTFAVYSSLYFTNNQWVNAGFSVADRLATVVTKRSIGLQSTNGTSYFTPAGCIDANGFIHYLVYDAASDGTTASAVYTDNFTIEITVLTKTGYDTLVPENSRRDAGLGGLLYVRRMTREVESLFWGNDEDNGIVVIGDYLPTQDYTTQPGPQTLSGAVDVLLSMWGFVTTAGTNRPYGTGSVYGNAIPRLMGPGSDLNYKVDPQSLVSTQNFEQTYSSGLLRYWAVDTPYGGGLAAAVYTDGIPSWAKSIAEFLGGYPALVQYNGELMLRISFRPRSTLGPIGVGGTTSIVVYYRLPGRPLVKL